MVMTRSQRRAAEEKKILPPTPILKQLPINEPTSLQREISSITPFDYMIEQGKGWNPSRMFVDTRLPFRKPQRDFFELGNRTYYEDLHRWNSVTAFQRRRHASYMLFLDDGQFTNRTYYFPQGIGCDQKNTTLTMNVYHHFRRLRDQVYDVELVYCVQGTTFIHRLTTDKNTVVEILHYIFSNFNVRREIGSTYVRRATPLYITSSRLDELLRTRA